MKTSDPSEKSDPGRIITFYSYKGGVGRSFALANVAAILAKWGAKVLCVDWDLEAPGLHHFFPSAHGKKTPNGLLHLLEAAASKELGSAVSWTSCVNKMRVGSSGDSVDLISAGRDAENYVRRVHDLDWQALYEEEALGEFLEKLRQEWTRDYDFVLLDSRTGLTDIGGVCTIHLPDIVVSVFTANHQSMDGTAYMAKRINEQRRNFFYSSGKALVMPLLSRWEDKDAPDDALQWLPKVLKTLKPSFDSWRHKSASVSRLAELLKVPYKAKWNFGERLAVLEESSTNPGSVSYHLHLIAALLARDFAATDALVQRPDSYVRDAAKIARTKRHPIAQLAPTALEKTSVPAKRKTTSLSPGKAGRRGSAPDAKLEGFVKKLFASGLSKSEIWNRLVVPSKPTTAIKKVSASKKVAAKKLPVKKRK